MQLRVNECTFTRVNARVKSSHLEAQIVSVDMNVYLGRVQFRIRTIVELSKFDAFDLR